MNGQKPLVDIDGAPMNGHVLPTQADRTEARLRQLTQAMQNLTQVIIELTEQQAKLHTAVTGDDRETT